MFLGRSEKGNNTSILKILSMSLAKYRVGLVAFVVFAVLITMFYLPRGGSTSEDNQLQEISHAIARPRLLQYCNRNISEGAEGRTFPGHEDWDLKYVVLTVRHGDRSAIHKIPGSADIKASPGSHSLLDPDAVRYSKSMSKFSVNLKQDGSTIDKKNDVIFFL